MIDFEKDYVLENERVLLRPLKAEDFDDLLEYATNEPETWDFNAFGASGGENLKAYITTALTHRAGKTEYPFIVVDKTDNKIVGSTRFYMINSITNTLELGYTWYGKKYRGTSINKNCKYLLLEFAFDVLNVERVGFRANNLNKRSINAMKSIGCVEEGVLRNRSIDGKGHRMDVIVLSIIKQEWFESVKQTLFNLSTTSC